MELNYHNIGTGQPLIILHGLFGSGDNWFTIAKLLEKHFEIYLIDQRNHGKSPHSNEFNYNVLTNDLLDFFKTHSISKAHILGHSMGGKVAMNFAKNYPEMLYSLTVIDIAPKNYNENLLIEQSQHNTIIDTLISINLTKITNRNEVEVILSKTIDSDKLRAFLLKSLHRNSFGNFEWLLNLQSLKENLENISGGFIDKEWNNVEITGFPVLFVKGGLSDYISKDDEILINKIFPAAEIFKIPNTGHWLHAENPNMLAQKIISVIN